MDGYSWFHFRAPDGNVYAIEAEAADELHADDLDEPAAIAFAIELEEEHALPLPEAELALADRDRLAGRAEEHGHAVRVAVADLHVLLADVLGAVVPVVVGVVVLGRHEPLEKAPRSLRESRAPTR